MPTNALHELYYKSDPLSYYRSHTHSHNDLLPVLSESEKAGLREIEEQDALELRETTHLDTVDDETDLSRPTNDVG